MSELRESVSVATEQARQANARLERQRQRVVRNRGIAAAALCIVIALLGVSAWIQSHNDNAFVAGVTVASLPVPAFGYRLAFERAGAMYVTDADGRNPVQIVPGPPVHGRCGDWGGPVWSPNGRYLAFRCGPTTVTIADARGSVISTFRAGLGWHVAWSPDSTRIAVWARRLDSPRYHAAVAIYGIDGLLLNALPVPRGFSGDYDPTWSPDGQSILADNVEVPVDGGRARTVPDGDVQAFCCPIAYSLDGTRAAYVESSALVVSPIDDAASAMPVADDAEKPVWSPVGDRIAFNETVGESYQIADGGPANGIRIVDLSSGTVTPVYTAGTGYAVNLLGFSPDGARILFCRMDAVPFSKSDHNLHSQLWSVGIDGSHPGRLARGAALGEWQP